MSGFLHSLAHGQRQVVSGHLDLVLSLQVSHPVCADAIDGDNEVAWDEVNLRGFAARSDLPTNTKSRYA